MTSIKHFIYLSFLLGVVVAFSTSCKKDQFSPECKDGSSPTYETGMKSIINSKCTSSGCHGSGSTNGDYTTYTGLSPDLNNGKFEKRVLEDQTMPKGSSLTEDQLNTLQCWSNNNFSEN